MLFEVFPSVPAELVTSTQGGTSLQYPHQWSDTPGPNVCTGESTVAAVIVIVSPTNPLIRPLTQPHVTPHYCCHVSWLVHGYSSPVTQPPFHVVAAIIPLKRSSSLPASVVKLFRPTPFDPTFFNRYLVVALLVAVPCHNPGIQCSCWRWCSNLDRLMSLRARQCTGLLSR